jgi:SAM-dependent methyltransferase
MRTLESHPDCLAHGEIFHEQWRDHLHPKLSQNGGFIELLEQQRLSDPIRFYQSILGNNIGFIAVGFKMWAIQCPVACDAILRAHSINKIILSRSNRLAQYSSALLAQTTGVWNRHVSDEKPWDSSHQLKNFDVEDFRTFCEVHDRVYQFYHENTTDNFIDLEYVDLIEGNISDVMVLLSLSNINVELKMKKLYGSSIIDRFALSEHSKIVAELARLGKLDWMIEGGDMEARSMESGDAQEQSRMPDRESPVPDEVYRAMTFERVWEDQICLNTQDEPRFTVLDSAALLENKTSWSVDPAKLNLPRPLQYYLDNDIAPIPLPEDREGSYGDRHFEYWLSGLETYSRVIELARPRAPSRYVDFGSASGRVVRHAAVDAVFDDVWALDINWRHVLWMQRYLSPRIKAVNTSSVPHIPIEDNSVDCLTAMSVFTHIESMETAWLAEIRRVLKPDALAIVSVVTENQLLAMDSTWPMYEPYTKHSRWNDHFIEDVQKLGKIVLRWHADRSYSSNVVYSKSYIGGVCGSLFEIDSHRPSYGGWQDELVLRKPKDLSRLPAMSAT